MLRKRLPVPVTNERRTQNGAPRAESAHHWHLKIQDPLGQGPAIWFQRMDAPRPQRNRIHLDVSVPDDEAFELALCSGRRVDDWSVMLATR